MNPILSQQMEEANRAMSANHEAETPGGEDRRAETSPQNGKKGGRPEVDYQQVADAFNSWLGAPLMRWRGKWWQYRKEQAYKEITEDAASGLFSEFSIAASVKYSINLRRNVFDAMKKNRVDDALTMPAWIDTGEKAEGWVAMQNGLLNVYAAAQGEAEPMRPHSPNFFASYSFPFPYTPNAPATKFQAFLESTLNDEESRRIILKMYGLLLVPLTRYNVFFVLYGPGGSGKSTCLNIIEKILGDDNCCHIRPAQFDEKHSLVGLAHCLANLVDEKGWLKSGVHDMEEIEATLKRITDGGKVWIEPKGVDGKSLSATARCVFTQNPPLPQFADRDPSLWDRMRFLIFPNRIRGTEGQRVNLAEEIVKEEGAAIFARAVQGLGALLRENPTLFPHTPDGLRLLEEHREACDKEKQFLLENYEVDPRGKVETIQVYGAYRTWCNEHGYGKKNDSNFAEEVRRVFPTVQKQQIQILGKRGVYWVGIAARSYEPDVELPPGW